MAQSSKTGFDRYFDKRMKDPDFAEGYVREREAIDQVDALIRQLDEARVDLGLSKAEFARRIGKLPVVVRRLLTKKGTNPTLMMAVRLGAGHFAVDRLPHAAATELRRRSVGDGFDDCEELLHDRRRTAVEKCSCRRSARWVIARVALEELDLPRQFCFVRRAAPLLHDHLRGTPRDAPATPARSMLSSSSPTRTRP